MSVELQDLRSTIWTQETLPLIVLCHSESATHVRHLRAVVANEWRELPDGKRGVQIELCPARLWRRQSELRVRGDDVH